MTNLPHELKASQIPETIDEAIDRINSALLITAMAHLTGGIDDIPKHYQDLMDKIQFLLRGYTADGHVLPSIKSDIKRTQS